MFLISARMGFGHCKKNFHYSSFLKGSFTLWIYYFRVQQSQLKILVFLKTFSARHGDQSHFHTESVLLHRMHACTSLLHLAYKKWWKMKNTLAPTVLVDEKHDINFHWPYHVFCISLLILFSPLVDPRAAPPPPCFWLFFFAKTKFPSKELVLNEYKVCLKMLEMAILETFFMGARPFLGERAPRHP